MKSKILNQTGEKTWALIFETDDEVKSGLLEFAKAKQLGGAHFTAIGGFRYVQLGYFDWQKKEYLPIVVDDQVEVLSLIGDVALQRSEPVLHAHAVVGTSDGTTRGGHLLKAYVRPTLEVILSESPQHLRRQFDESAGLALIKV
jgi:uncharacterized protein